MAVKLMEKVLKGALGHELVLKGFTLYELDDDGICLEYEDGKQWFFTPNNTIVQIRKTAMSYLKEKGKL